MGAHASAPAMIETDMYGAIALDELLEKDKSLGSLPYLYKILDVARMLSLQVHPDKESAVIGFEKEETAGIPIDAANRNYKDKNHKPEVMIALSEFWLLHGFANDIEQRLDTYSFLTPFKKDFQVGGIKQLYKTLMELDQQQVNDKIGRAHV